MWVAIELLLLVEAFLSSLELESQDATYFAQARRACNTKVHFSYGDDRNLHFLKYLIFHLTMSQLGNLRLRSIMLQDPWSTIPLFSRPHLRKVSEKFIGHFRMLLLSKFPNSQGSAWDLQVTSVLTKDTDLQIEWFGALGWLWRILPAPWSGKSLEQWWSSKGAYSSSDPSSPLQWPNEENLEFFFQSSTISSLTPDWDPCEWAL